MMNNSLSVQEPSSETDFSSNPQMPLEEKYGERQIAEGQLITFPNPRLGRRYNIQITLPEFTCKCPFSGYPDFATIHITYIPDQRVVELKALKLYINSYRDRYISTRKASIKSWMILLPLAIP
jgi:7-cyano-7-deazaguanine reductase